MIKHMPYRVGEWLPSDQNVLNDWIRDLMDEAEKAPIPLHPVVQDLQDLIESDAEIYALFNMMFEQVPLKYQHTEYGNQIRDYHQFIALLNIIMTKAPTYNDTGCVGFPINALLDWAMGTESGFAAFLNDKLNAQLKKVLNHWGTFLKSEDSKYVLSTENAPLPGTEKSRTRQYYWLSDRAMVAMMNMMRQGKPDLHMDDADKARLQFIETFVCDPALPHYGFNCWDDFFLREFREGVRPVDGEDNDAVIVNACESAPFKIARGDEVKLLNKFWIKGQPYSILHMLDNDERAEQFVGGTVYQAFLSAKSYHRWNSPVSGTIVKTKNVDGTYYSETPSVGYDEAGPNESQGYISEVAARGIVFIEADNPNIGLMCIIFIGMAEVSSCDIRVYEGQRVTKGQPLGMFHFGGSTHCMLFRKGVDVVFDLPVNNPPGLDAYNLFVGSRLAHVE